ncbi:MAG: hypothetical protein R8G34_16400 [Paracoccaceae bacterium]|nr:hypothetical protein [Paracoccaceae bacterium]
MSGFDNYYDFMRDEDVSAYPVWPIGTPIKVGDYGTLERRSGLLSGRYQFVRFSNINDRLTEATAELEREPFTGEVVQDSGVSFEASANAETIAGAPVEVSGRLVADGETKLAVHFETGYIERFKRMDAIVEAFQHDPASAEYVLVTEIRVAQTGGAIVSDEGGWSVGAKGDLKALEAIKLGDAAVALASRSGAVAARNFHQPSAIFLKLYGRGWFGFSQLDATKDEDEGIVELHPDLMP